MVRDAAAPRLTIQTLGPLVVTAHDGRDCTPTGSKAKGILALLACAPGQQRSRDWVQDKLWSGRDTKQGRYSLRQALTAIRLAFGQYRGFLVTKGNMVALDLAAVEVLRGPAVADAADADRGTDESILFEGLDVNDPEFEDWLRDRREQYRTELEARKSGDLEVHRRRTFQISLASRPDHTKPGRLLLLAHAKNAPSATARERLLADGMIDTITKTLCELGTVNVVALDGPQPHAPGEAFSTSDFALTLRAEVAETPTGDTCRIALSCATSNRTLWTTNAETRNAAQSLDEPTLLRNLNEMVEEVFRNFQIKMPEGEEQRVATVLCQLGIQKFFLLGDANMLAADRLFAQAYELERRGIFLAWRAYIRTYMLVELIATDRKRVAEEALDFMYRALELEPRNSYVASLSAQVHLIVRQSYVAAFELAERSVQLNRANPIGWVCLGLAECNLGRTQAGYEHTLIARELAGASPFRFKINALACIAGSMAGDIERAIILGEAAHGLSPTFKPPLRFLTALYLLCDKRAESQAMVDKLRVTEPEFSYAMLRDKSYPVSSLHRSSLLDKLPRRQI